ncbi:probable carotenoid cleavage dioxygenase 4, chloroplastic [Nicotiana tabacum]|uniref:Carotenoid cleavage dioxygenase 4 n=1 Tax=Nicotiana tabacum TaxID=4097 RepID=F8UWS2_TOBAC|nr:probable carotenoid cleavage dioxygenase 4, chloroplastic [Nicotiana tabacum]AEI61930.1 carotenoid cleavage dioxygenase 4 [Nicotiana tabacum]AKO22632.1 carotenoid cleavage dioxygenase 4-2 [Nicotiana tabacum]
MDAFSSTFLSTLSQHPKSLLSPNYSPNTSSSPILKVSSVRIEERPQTTTTTTRTKPQEKPTPSPYTPPKDTPKRQLPTKSITTKKPVEPSFPSVIFNAFDDFVNTFIDPPLKPCVDPKYILSNNFAPVDELPPTECEVVVGSLPPCLDGAYIRNGPNPQYLPRGPYHLFDGDGMLHSIKISQSKATLCSRYVKTYKYTIEREAGSPVFPNVFSGFNGLTASAARGAITAARAIAGQFNPTNGIGLANTSLALFGGKLFALGESDLPYAVKLAPDGDIITLGRYDFDGKLFMSMTAHPKIDPDTNEAFAFRYGPMPPFLTYFRIEPNGTKTPDVPIFSMTRPSFLHDFAITNKFAIFSDIQIGMNPLEFITGGSPVSSDSGKIPRLGVIPRYAKNESEMKWFDVPGINIVHAINAWDEDDGDTIVMVAPNILSVEHTLERMDMIHASVEKVKIDLKSGMVSRQPLSTRNLDFGVINPAYVGKKNKYVYAAIGDPMPKIAGIAKLDVSVAEADRRDCIVACRLFGEGCFGGEPYFVANNSAADEDDGYVVSFVHNEKTGESRFLVMDAKSPNLDIVAAVKLPRRVPYGFHGLFVRETDLRKLM